MSRSTRSSVPKRGRIDSFFLPSKSISSASPNVDDSVPIEVAPNTQQRVGIELDSLEDTNIEGTQNVEVDEFNGADCAVSFEETRTFQRVEHGDGVQRISLQRPGSNTFDVFHLQRDPGLRTPILQFPVHYRDDIRRTYLNMGAYHPNLHKRYPKTWDGSQDRGFNYKWFEKFPWLEYSPAKDAAFCFQCSLFDTDATTQEAFTVVGFKTWKKVNCGSKCSFIVHEGTSKSPHSTAMGRADDLMNQRQHIAAMFNRQSEEEVARNRLRLTTTIECIRWLGFQGCPFRGNNESKGSKNRGNFIELVKYSAKLNKDIREVVLDNAPGNAQYTSPLIQKEILNIFATLVREKIREEIGNAKFCILVDESKDESDKEQMATVLRYVDKEGNVQECFFDVQRVDNVCALTLKNGITNVLTRFNLQVQNLRGQGYDGANNMRGAMNGLQALFLKDCPYAYYVHCFAHRLQLALEKAATARGPVWKFYCMLNSIINLVTASSKRIGDFQSAQEEDTSTKILNGDVQTGKGANQVGTLRRASDTRWSSHYASACSLIRLFDPTCQLIKKLGACKGNDSYSVGEAQSVGEEIKSFRFVFVLHLMNKIMGITDILCQGLQLKSQDIINAMNLVSTTQTLLQRLRDDGWTSFLDSFKLFCKKHDIRMPDMEDRHLVGTGRSCQQVDNITIEHHYRIDIFNEAIDVQLTELKSRFPEETMELLILTAALDPRDSFKRFKIEDICKLAERFYPEDFSNQDIHSLRNQLHHYEVDVLSHESFQGLSTISELCRRMFETGKSVIYCEIDKIIRLVLTLPVSTATAERVFSAMNLIKTTLRNKMGSHFLNDSMMLYIERLLAEGIPTEAIIEVFITKQNRRVQLEMK